MISFHSPLASLRHTPATDPVRRNRTRSAPVSNTQPPATTFSRPSPVPRPSGRRGSSRNDTGVSGSVAMWNPGFPSFVSSNFTRTPAGGCQA